MDREAKITEEDLEKIFTDKKKIRQHYLHILTTWSNRVVFFFIFLVAAYLFINFHAITIKLGFWYKSDFQAAQPIDGGALSINSNTLTDTAKQVYLPDVADNHVKIPVLNIDAPITWRVPNIPKDVSNALQSGAIQVDGTALPGQSGNMYITGHSSNYVWAKGSYNNVFAIIDQLAAGDMIYIRYLGVTYTYKVTEQKVVVPTDLSILKSNGDSTLSLVTCWPVGTALRRLVVSAIQIYPDPTKNTAFSGSSNLSTLTSGL